MKMRYRKGSQKAGGRPSAGKPLVERLRGGVVVAALAITGCTMNINGIPAADGAADMREETSVLDISKLPDLKPEAGTISDIGHDKSSADMPKDSKVPDKGADQLLADFNKPDVVAAPDKGTVCKGVVNDAIFTKLVNTGNSINVGGYEIKNNGPSPGGITVDINCGSSASLIQQSLYCKSGGPEAVLVVPADGKKIRVYNHGSNQTAASLSIHVETL